MHPIAYCSQATHPREQLWPNSVFYFYIIQLWTVAKTVMPGLGSWATPVAALNIDHWGPTKALTIVSETDGCLLIQPWIFSRYFWTLLLHSAWWTLIASQFDFYLFCIYFGLTIWNTNTILQQYHDKRHFKNTFSVTLILRVPTHVENRSWWSTPLHFFRNHEIASPDKIYNVNIIALTFADEWRMTIDFIYHSVIGKWSRKLACRKINSKCAS